MFYRGMGKQMETSILRSLRFRAGNEKQLETTVLCGIYRDIEGHLILG